MQEILYNIIEHPIYAIILFILLFSGVLYVFVKTHVSSVYLGLGKIIGSLIISPFIYYKKCLLTIIDFSQSKIQIEESKQYLLKRLLTMMEVFLVIISTAILVGGIISGWNTFLPPRALRDEVSMIEESIDKTNTELKTFSEQINSLNEEWSVKKDSVVNSFRNQRNSIIEKSRTDNNSIEYKLQYRTEVSSYFSALKSYLQQNEYQDSKYLFDRIRSNARSWYVDLYYVPEDVRNDFSSYLNSWYERMIASLELKNMTEENFRRQLQPNFSSIDDEYRGRTNDLKYQTERLAELQKILKYDFSGMIVQVLFSLLIFILFIWVIGLVLELLWLNVDIADNIKHIASIKTETEIKN
jgi:hypothetical protein